jgi:acyl-CoA synthetase (AMP-forming)/AMP-acid ligase II
MSHNVARFLEEMALRQGDGPAVLAPAGRGRYERRSFAELEAEAGGAARCFAGRGIARGTRVLLMVRPGLDLIRCVFALFKLGAVPVVIDPGMGLRAFLRCVRGAAPEALVGIPKAHWVARLAPAAFRSARCRVVVGRGFGRRAGERAAEGPVPAADSAADELAAILFTSGSTGPAKGVLYEHGMFEAQVDAIRRQYRIEPGEVDLPMLPVFALFNPALGMCTVVPEMDPARPARVDPVKIVRAIRETGVTNSFGSPALWRRIAAYCEERGIRLGGVRRVLMAGAPAPPDLMERMQALLPDGEVHSPYGATEALPVSSISAREVAAETGALTAAGRGTCVGRPLPGVAVRIIRPLDGPLPSLDGAEEMPGGEVGEILVQGPSVTRRYDRRPEAEAAAKTGDPDGGGFWHRMGDLGYLDGEGRLWFCGRKAERVDTAGGPLYTDCVEAVFNTHPKVARSALVGLSGARPGARVPALAVEPVRGMYPKTDTEKEAFRAELRALGRSRPGTAAIESFFFERAFPVDVRHNAKIHRLALARKYAGRRRGAQP